mmetsp:Transcript_21891/g.32625  ORF Transcript_21891/g.32625 Transcript_21891/m.32625 type:complete len:358 (-) Transcript_21891:155-1228(-)
MGLCATTGDLGTKEERERDRALQRELKKQNQQEEQIHKLLLLGAGQSGKSTLFKQMISLYGNGFPEEERKEYLPIIFGNVLNSMQTLIEEAAGFAQSDEKYKLPAKLEAGIDEVENPKKDDYIDEKLAKIIAELWKEPAIQLTYARRADFQLNESAEYFFNKVEALSVPGYIPDEQDLLRARRRTLGIIQSNFVIDGNQFQMFDVGGQRSERKKWIHCFEDVSLVLFVVAMSAYNQVLFEEQNTNRIVEALGLFEQVANSRWFQRVGIVLFLNKRDLFQEKIRDFPITDCEALKDFKGDTTNYEETSEFIAETFMELTGKHINFHFTCATDQNNVNRVFDSVKEQVMQKSIEAAGLQ